MRKPLRRRSHSQRPFLARLLRAGGRCLEASLPKAARLRTSLRRRSHGEKAVSAPGCCAAGETLPEAPSLPKGGRVAKAAPAAFARRKGRFCARLLLAGGRCLKTALQKAARLRKPLRRHSHDPKGRSVCPAVARWRTLLENKAARLRKPLLRHSHAPKGRSVCPTVAYWRTLHRSGLSKGVICGSNAAFVCRRFLCTEE